MEHCSYSVRPPNEPRPSFGGFLLISLYYPDSISILPLPWQPEVLPRWPGKVMHWCLCLPAKSCPLKIPLTQHVDHVRLAGYLRGLGNSQAV